MTRISSTFERLKKQGDTGLIAYLTVGFPDLEATLEIVPALADAGMDMIELGVPFSDPLADGATIQRASQVALRNGVTLGDCLEVARKLRQRVPLVPLLLMGYYNPILAYGLERFALDAEAAGVDGLIVPDLPPEEAGPLRRACQGHGVDVVFLLAPTSTDHRIREVCQAASGFIYCVSLTGVTGARTNVPSELPAFIERVRRHAKVPLAVGFGISTKEHVRVVGKVADAVIIGSALVGEIERAAPESRLQQVVRFASGLRAAATGAGGS